MRSNYSCKRIREILNGSMMKDRLPI